MITMAAATASAQFSQPVRDVENPARTPFVLRGSCSAQADDWPTSCQPTATIAAGYRMVIETVSYGGTFANAAYRTVAVVTTVDGIGPNEFYLPVRDAGQIPSTNYVVYTGTLSARIYTDVTPKLHLAGSYGAQMSANFYISGYLIKK